MSRFTNLNVTVYVTGSIACYKTIGLIRSLKRRSANVRVVMSRGAQQFISPVTFRAISGHQVLCDQSWHDSGYRIPHVDLAKWTALAIVMPATANVIAKMANGIADGIVSTCLLATSAPKIIIPAMNDKMWNNPATRRNVKRLDQFSHVYRLGPVTGKLAEGYTAKGRMVEPGQVINYVAKLMCQSQRLSGLRIIVTAGGTQEPIDPVRFITNGSTGKMGYAISKQATEMGADVTLISGHAEVPVPDGVKFIKVRTTEEMARMVLKTLPQSQVLIMSAALADYKPQRPSTQKIKKARHKSGDLNLALTRTPDVLKAVAQVKKANQLTVGFAAETQDLIRNATLKLKAKKLDLIVANDVANSKIGFGSDDNQVTLIDARGHREKTPVEPKALIAKRLLMTIAKLKDDRS